MYTWNTGRSWITSSSPKVVTIWMWVDVCLKIVMLPEGIGGLSRRPALGPGSWGPGCRVGAEDVRVLYGSHLVSLLLVITSS